MRAPPPDIATAATAAQQAHGVPASVSLAQWALESAWGEKCTGRFNFFGVKAVVGQPSTLCWTHEVVHGKSVSVQQPFRDYASVQDAFEEHAALLTHPQYAAAWPFRTLESFVRAISPHYATDPQYADKLLTLIREEGFAAYDTETVST